MKHVRIVISSDAVMASGSRIDLDRDNGSNALPYSEVTEALRQLLAKVGSSTLVTVELQAPWVQYRRLVRLPPVGDRDLRHLVQREPHRYFRRREGDLITDAEWEENSDPPVAEAGAVDSALVAALLDTLGDFGITLLAVEAPGRVVSAPGFHFSNGDVASLRLSRLAHSLRPFALTAALVWIVAGIGYAGDLLLDSSQAERALSEIRPDVEALDDIEATVAEVAAVAEALALVRPEGAWAKAAIEALGAVVPDSTTVRSAHLFADSGLVRVEAPGPHALDSIVLRSPWVQEVVSEEGEGLAVTATIRLGGYNVR